MTEINPKETFAGDGETEKRGAGGRDKEKTRNNKSLRRANRETRKTLEVSSSAQAVFGAFQEALSLLSILRPKPLHGRKCGNCFCSEIRGRIQEKAKRVTGLALCVPCGGHGMVLAVPPGEPIFPLWLLLCSRDLLIEYCVLIDDAGFVFSGQRLAVLADFP